MKYCKSCLEIYHKSKYNYQKLTIADLSIKYKNDKNPDKRIQSVIRSLCRSWNKHLSNNPCQNCQYNVHIEFCHIKPVSSFDLNIYLEVINHENNILILCRNCHWEFDNRLISLEDIIGTQGKNQTFANL